MRLIETGSFPISEIDFGDRIRDVNPAKAAIIAETLKIGGVARGDRLLQPIGIARIGSRHKLIFGAHRIAGHQLAGLEDIQTKIYECETDQPDLEMRLYECIENIGREELCALDRAGHLAELKRVYEKLYPDSRRGVAGGKKRQNSATAIFAVADEIAAKAGLSERTFFAAVAMWNGLTPETRKTVKGTWLADHQSQLSALAKIEAKKQSKVLSLVLPPKEGTEPKAASVLDAISIIDNNVNPKAPNEAAFAALVKAWHKAPRKAQKQFVDYLRQHKALGVTR